MLRNLMNRQANKNRIPGVFFSWVLFGILLVSFVLFVIVANHLNWEWTGFTGDKLWDWMKYLIVPITLAIAPILGVSLRRSKRSQRIWRRWKIIWIAFFVILLLAFAILIMGGYLWDWEWTGFSGNTLWDWISLLFLPVTLMVVTAWFNTRNNQQASTSQRLEHITPSQRRALLTLIPTEPLPAKPSSRLFNLSTVLLPSSVISRSKGTGLFRFNISRRRVLAYIAIAILVVGSVAFEYRVIAVNKDRPIVSSTTLHASDGYDAAIAKNGVMLGYNIEHTRVDPYEKVITPVTVRNLEEKWSQPIDGTIESTATVAYGTVFISSNNGELYALKATTGAVSWRGPIGSNDFGNAPTVAKGVVYLGAPDDYLYALDASTGKVKWRSLTGGKIGSSPTLANGVIYIGSDDGYLYAFRASDGKLLWKYLVHRSYPIRSSPTVANGLVYVGSDDGGLYVIHSSSGTLAWSYRTENKVRSTPAVVDGIIYVGSDDGKLYAFNAAGCGSALCLPLWFALTKGEIESSPAVYRGVVYVGSDDGKLYAFKAGGCGGVSCLPIWSTSAGKPVQSSPIIANGVLFVGSNSNTLYAYTAAGCGSTLCQSIWSFPTAGSVISSPVVANGIVYVGTNDYNNPKNGYFYAFGLSGSA